MTSSWCLKFKLLRRTASGQVKTQSKEKHGARQNVTRGLLSEEEQAEVIDPQRGNDR